MPRAAHMSMKLNGPQPPMSEYESPYLGTHSTPRSDASKSGRSTATIFGRTGARAQSERYRSKRASSGRHQGVIRASSGRHQGVIRASSGIIRASSGHQGAMSGDQWRAVFVYHKDFAVRQWDRLLFGLPTSSQSLAQGTQVQSLGFKAVEEALAAATGSTYPRRSSPV